MCNWFKKLFGCKCHCEQDHCDCCSHEEEKKPVESTPAPVAEVKPEVAPEATKEENVEKAQ